MTYPLQYQFLQNLKFCYTDFNKKIERAFPLRPSIGMAHYLITQGYRITNLVIFQLELYGKSITSKLKSDQLKALPE